MASVSKLVVDGKLIEIKVISETANYDCRGKACKDLKLKASGRSVMVKNEGGKDISVEVHFVNLFGQGDWSITRTLWPDDKEDFQHQFPHNMYVSYIDAEYE